MSAPRTPKLDRRAKVTRRRLSDSQFDCLWALFLGSKGSGSNPRTLESLRHRGLATVRRHQGEMLWEASATGEALIADDERAQP